MSEQKGGVDMGIGGAVSACLCVLSPGFMGSASNTAPHTAAANMAYLLRTKEGIAHGESDKLIPPHNLPTQREIQKHWRFFSHRRRKLILSNPPIRVSRMNRKVYWSNSSKK